MYIGIDFDGTLADHKFPHIGEKVPGGVETCRDLIAEGYRLILWTMRSGVTLSAAVHWCRQEGIEFFGVNTNPIQLEWTTSPKAYCHIYIDDAALGCPLVDRSHLGVGARDWVDWPAVRQILADRGVLPLRAHEQ